MPKLFQEELSEADESDGLESIPARATSKPKKESTKVSARSKSRAVDSDEDDEGNGDHANGDGGEKDDDEEEEDEDEETFTVEKIITHDFSDDGVALYKIKWLGYDSESDMTWETEANLREGAGDLLDAYHKKIGGKPVDPKQTKGRGRGKRKASYEAPDYDADTPGTVPANPAKRARSKAKNPRAFVPPSGSWEDELQTIHTIKQEPLTNVKGRPDHVNRVFIVFNDGKKAAYDLEVIRKKAPQKLIDYFLSRMQFRPSQSPGS